MSVSSPILSILIQWIKWDNKSNDKEPWRPPGLDKSQAGFLASVLLSFSRPHALFNDLGLFLAARRVFFNPHVIATILLIESTACRNCGGGGGQEIVSCLSILKSRKWCSGKAPSTRCMRQARRADASPSNHRFFSPMRTSV